MIYALRSVSCLRSSTHNKCVASILQRRFVKLNPIPAISTEVNENFEEKNARLSRPLSPHITIYKFPMPAVMSITHRATGLMLVGYAFAFGAACRLYPVSELISMIKSLELSFTSWTAIKTVFLFPYTYHLINGLRHLVWDLGVGLSMKSVYKTGYTVIALSILASALFASYVK